MLKRYSNNLNDFIEKAIYEGFAVEPKWKILLWYDQERFTVRIRNEIRERWEEWEQGTDLLFAEVGSSIMIVRADAFWE
ncbi:MAG: hypothetical protein GY749_00980 [Desulfobacteraceae bacterium]|nr:hypothetical protein [Desulfobacteraceae bacterium]